MKKINFLKNKPLVIILGIALLLLFILGLTNGCTKKNMNSFDNKDGKSDKIENKDGDFDKIRGERPNRSDLPPNNISRTGDERPDLSNMTSEEIEEFRKNGPNPTEGMSPEELEEFRSNGMDQET